ncbi:MAG: helix-turn-helix domain-containing protein [Bdellovibrio sp.]|nr:helix-turn-helix domain-containing protein [Bdellovibrio sp.]
MGIQDTIKPGDCCPWCDRPVDQEMIDRRRLVRRKRQQESIQKRQTDGKHFGRVFKYAHIDFKKHLDQGLSTRQIAKIVGCAPSTVVWHSKLIERSTNEEIK